jgi:DNA-binding MarR family transcriptional regulator
MSEAKRNAVDALFEIAPKVVRCVGCGVAKKETGLTFNQIRCVNFLANKKHYLGDIARDRSVSPASASSLIDALESEGYVKREIDAIDHRKILVGLTKKGHECFERMRSMSNEILGDMVGKLSDEEASQLAILLNKMQ